MVMDMEEEKIYKIVKYEKVYRPQSVVDWYNLGIEDEDYDYDFKGELWERACRHLSAMGWRIRYTWKRELMFLFDSPDGKTYNSLRRACKAVVDLQHDDLKLDDDIEPVDHRKPPARVFCWLIDKEAVLPNSKVHYRNRSSGVITRRGIKCDCCSIVFSLSGFGKHADHSADGDLVNSTITSTSTNIQTPAASNFILEDGRSLMDCIISLTSRDNDIDINPLKYDSIIYDNICSFCHESEGVELFITCDHCPSAFHPHCVGLGDEITEVQDRDHDYHWICPLCSCGVCGNGEFQGEATTTDGDEHEEHRRLVVCRQCELNYHTGCIKNNASVIYFDGFFESDAYFCSKGCENIFSSLRKILLGNLIPVDSHDNSLTWTLWKSVRSGLTSFSALAENEKKLPGAIEVMHECFDPAATYNDVVEDIINNRFSKLRCMYFGGFYTMVLKRGNELISVAAVRIHGQKVAEMPLIGTRPQYRRLGMCRVLMNELEKQLSVLGVERITLPAIPSALHICINSLGFSKMTSIQRSSLVKYNLLHFPDTVMCHKFLNKSGSSSSSTQN